MSRLCEDRDSVALGVAGITLLLVGCLLFGIALALCPGGC